MSCENRGCSGHYDFWCFYKSGFWVVWAFGVVVDQIDKNSNALETVDDTAVHGTIHSETFGH